MTQPGRPNRVTERELVRVTGNSRLPCPTSRTGWCHQQFRRFGGVSDLRISHLRSIVQRHDEITAAGIREVVFFHSSADELRKYTAELPFATIADPEKRY